MSKLRLDLDVVLPAEAGHADPCAKRLVEALEALTGVERVHISEVDNGAAVLCVHFDPDRLSIQVVERAVRDAGAELSTKFGHLAVDVRGIRHERHARLIEDVMRRQQGVLHASVAFGAGRVFLEFDPSSASAPALRRILDDAGLELEGDRAERIPLHSTATRREPEDGHEHDGHAHDHSHGGVLGPKAELVSSILCGVLTLSGWLCERLGAEPIETQIVFAAAYASGGGFMLREVWLSIRARRFEIDLLMLIAAIGAAVLGEWFEGALLLFLFSLGHGLEGYAMTRARRAIEALAELVPRTALVRSDDGTEREVDVEELRKGMRVVVKPNTRFPADGIVESGTSSVDQAPITGESVPVDKTPAPDVDAALADVSRVPREHTVFAGSINGASPLVVVVAKAAADSTLAKVVEMVSRAEASKSPTQRFTDRFERIFVPVLLAVVVLMLFAWTVVDEPFSASFYRAMAVLVAASPCALAIATPSAVLAAVARAARRGVLVKGGAHLESLGEVDVVAFDKTGTLTEGRPKLTDVVAAEGVDEGELLRVAVAVERQSDHPIARAVVAGALRIDTSDIPEARDVEAIAGHGVQARIGDREVRIGKPGMWRDGLPEHVDASARRLQAEGRTIMIVEAGGRFLGVLGVMDTARANAAAVVRRLAELGVHRSVMLSGDNQQVADTVGNAIGITDVRADLLPEDKVRVIDELVAGGGRVAMVGDGVNDAPALARATVGVAMGAGGSDVALETADVALMGDDLEGLPFAIALGRASRRVIRQNLWASLGMVAILVPSSALGLTGIGAAVALHEGSTLVVVFNALRLLAFRFTASGAKEKRA